MAFAPPAEGSGVGSGRCTPINKTHKRLAPGADPENSERGGRVSHPPLVSFAAIIRVVTQRYDPNKGCEGD